MYTSPSVSSPTVLAYITSHQSQTTIAGAMRWSSGSAFGGGGTALGWWVWVVLGRCSLLIWYAVWLRSLIRDSSSQREARAFYHREDTTGKSEMGWRQSGEEGDGGREEIIWRGDESEGEENTCLSAWVSGEGNEGSRKGAPGNH